MIKNLPFLPKLHCFYDGQKVFAGGFVYLTRDPHFKWRWRLIWHNSKKSESMTMVKDSSIGSFLHPTKYRLRKKGTNINHILKEIVYLNIASFVSALINSVLAKFFNCWSVHQKWRKRHSPCCSSCASSSLITFKDLIGLL